VSGISANDFTYLLGKNDNCPVALLMNLELLVNKTKTSFTLSTSLSS